MLTPTTSTSEELIRKRCAPCEGGVPRYTAEQAQEQLAQLGGWSLSADGLRIRKSWVMKDFRAAIALFNRVADLAESEGHHPDLHLERYRHVTVELWTHAIGGLSENDFILAAKIDRLPMALKPQP